jgi:D-alanyl-lipoteichoic acid acyltransferase DltB (MBOAT superfamily)
MVFSSVRFFGFLVALLVLLAPSYPTRRKKIVLALASCFFYAAWDYRYLALLLLVSVIDYYAAQRIHATDDSKTRRTWLALSMASNLAILGYFKYTNFFISTLSGLSSSHIQGVDILLPAGFSF